MQQLLSPVSPASRRLVSTSSATSACARRSRHPARLEEDRSRRPLTPGAATALRTRRAAAAPWRTSLGGRQQASVRSSWSSDPTWLHRRPGARGLLALPGRSRFHHHHLAHSAPRDTPGQERRARGISGADDWRRALPTAATAADDDAAAAAAPQQPPQHQLLVMERWKGSFCRWSWANRVTRCAGVRGPEHRGRLGRRGSCDHRSCERHLKPPQPSQRASA